MEGSSGKGNHICKGLTKREVGETEGERGRPEPHSKCLGRAGCGQHLGGAHTGEANRAPSEGLLRSHNAELAEPPRALKQEWGPNEAPQILGGWGESA